MREAITRRDWLAATAAAVAAAGCARPVHLAPSETTIVRAAAYDQRLYDIVRRLIASERLDVRGRRVVIKPNLVDFEPGTAINTHPLLVHAACEAFRALGASQVTIAEGPGNRRDTLGLAEAAGYFRIIPGFEDSFVDLNVDEVTLVDLPQRFSRLKRVYLPNTVRGAALFVSMPKMKTHHWAGATLSMKNLFGVVPGGVRIRRGVLGLNIRAIDSECDVKIEIVPGGPALRTGAGQPRRQGPAAHSGILSAG